MNNPYNTTGILASYLLRHGIVLLLLLSNAACSTLDLGKGNTAIFYQEQLVFVPLRSELPILPQEDADIRERIENGFEQLQAASSFRTRVESAESLPLLNLEKQMTAPYTISGRIEKNEAGLVGNITLHFKSQDLESVCISTTSPIRDDGSYKSSTQIWHNLNTDWQAGTDIEVWTCMRFMGIAVSSPYDFIELPLNYVFRSYSIGYESLSGVLTEVYEVQGQIVEPGGEPEIITTTQIWLDAKTGLPVKSSQPPRLMDVQYEVIDEITIEPPCTADC